MSSYVDFLRSYRPRLRRTEIAEAMGLSIATLTRRLRDGLTLDEVLAGADLVGASRVDALLFVGAIRDEDLRRTRMRRDLILLTDEEMLEELLRRRRARVVVTGAPDTT